jgi:glycosyltransferase involved in cell wall biosynthesis
MKIVQLTTDNRNQHKRYDLGNPYFGTAPTGLLDGFTGMPDVEVHVISCASHKTASPEKLAPNIWFHQPHVPKLGWGRSLFLGCVLATRHLIWDINPDIVHGQGTERDCAMAAVLSGYPNVLTLHGNMRVHAARGENRGRFYYKLAALLEGYCLKRTGGVVAISRYTEDLVKDLTPRTWLLPNAVDRRFFTITPEPQAVPRILFVGSIDERKNPLGLLRACEPMLRAGACTLTFAGQANASSPYVQDFLRSAAALPGVELPGFIGRDELGQQFGRSSLLVLPTFEDNCPMVVLEAMAAGLPVAASRVGGVPDLITHDQDGLMFDPSDPADVRACIERLVKEPETRARLGAAGRLTAQERFHPKVIAAEHLKIYREVLGRR